MPAITDFDWKKFDRVLDIGGAYGSMLAAVLEENSAAQGVLFELPQASLSSARVVVTSPEQCRSSSRRLTAAQVRQVAERAKAVWAEQRPHLLSRTTIVGGSFFDQGSYSSIPLRSQRHACARAVSVAFVQSACKRAAAATLTEHA